MNSIFSRDSQIKQMEAMLDDSEKHLGQFCSILASYTRKTARLRDKADLLVRELNNFSSREEPEVRNSIKNFAEDLAMVQDYRQAEVERLEIRVVSPLKAYGDIFKIKRADLKRFSADRKREIKELQKLNNIRQKNPADRQTITQAEMNAHNASMNASRNTKKMEETIMDLQRQKLEDIKKIFSEFIMVEMLFHAKALEVYTHTFQNLETMDVEKDLELFRRRIQLTDIPFESQVLQSPLSSSPGPTYPSPTHSSFRQTSSLRQMKSFKTRRILRRQEEVDDDNDGDQEEEEDAYDSEGPYEESESQRESYAATYVRLHRQK
ncbi:protein FAM92B-like isoform X1 [Denticeps clupeoides]|uniref:protein FAM92B-like isoform X1 n=1 Tax=Denticeps clupeoides TaxID=299321 RepID=UPI0010A3B8D1|nr:protein FAM92B isoform X1 [Denticeps clupeoides]